MQVQTITYPHSPEHYPHTIMQAQTIAAEAAGVLAENAKTFVTEKLTKSKVLNYFGWGKKP